MSSWPAAMQPYQILLHACLAILPFIRSSFASTVHFRLPSAPGYQSRNVCPTRCSTSGPQPGNWSVYHTFEQTSSCNEVVFYDFTLSDHVDDADTLHRIYACTTLGSDWINVPANTTDAAVSPSTTTSNVTYQVGYWPEASGSSVVDHTTLVSSQIREYLAGGFASVAGPVVLFAGVGNASFGLYIGEGLQNQNTGSFALQSLENILSSSTLNNTASLAMQYCKANSTADHIFGFFASGNGTFSSVQTALASWSNATCLSLPESSSNVTGPAVFTTPLFNPSNITVNGTLSGTNSSTILSSKRNISPRGDCSTTQVMAGDSCASLAQKCGISGSDFTKYNPGTNFCATLQPYQHVCCSAGTLPDFAPAKNSDGSCATYTVQSNDYCSAIAAKYSLTVDQLGTFNSDTWGWNGCSNLWVGTIICLSDGAPPMPASVSNAVCGPQVPGTQVPPAGTNISTLNPCPLNACCDVFGQCGTTAEFCTNTRTGAPGTAAPGTNGCISNCGTNIVRSAPPSVYRSIAFYEGFNLGRPCLYQSASQVDAASYSHLFFAFATLDTSFTVQVGDVLSTYEFGEFLSIGGPAKILSIGGWDFSTDPSTYSIFRDGVTPANRQTMANNIATFVNNNNLDGVNVDWEYPGAQDIPGIPAASLDDGDNYLEFLKELRSLLPNKEISVAAPASYWYLKGFPISEMSDVLDYIIYMTYDLHGQWDANNQWSQQGCSSGTCLRTDVNLTETVGALVMITKAGVPSNKVVVGTTSYGRSFAMADAGCYGPDCGYLGSAGASQASAGPCTGTSGYISNAEIQEIISNSSRVNQNFVDANSNTNILVYDDTQWVGWMDDTVKASRTSLYKNLAMGGTTDWASDLQKYNDPPDGVDSWSQYKADIKNGVRPGSSEIDGPRSGNWTSLDCSIDQVQNIPEYTADERWSGMDCPDAWSDMINQWKNTDRTLGYTFSASTMNFIHGPEQVDCGDISTASRCVQTLQCAGFIGKGSGAGAYEIYNSFVVLNGMYSEYLQALDGVAATTLDAAYQLFEVTFTPVNPPPGNNDELLEILIALVTLGLSAVAAPFFNIVFKTLPFFKANPNGLGIFKDDTSGLITFGSAVAKDVITPATQASWDVSDQANLTAYLGQAIHGWGYAAGETLARLFDGDDASIDALTTATANGRLIEGSVNGVATQPDLKGAAESAFNALEDSVLKAFFAFAIPTGWYYAGTHAFVIDSGYACDADHPTSAYMSTDTVNAAQSCFNNQWYYLVYPKGKESEANCVPNPAGPQSCSTGQFLPPPGLTDLDGSKWGGVTVDDLVAGAVRTYMANGNANGGPVADPTNPQTVSELSNQDITTPGYIRIPVCSQATAHAAWETPNRADSTDPNYPCVPLQGITDCGEYTFEDQTSGGSPPVADCGDIITNIQGTTGEWNTGIGKQRTIASAGQCKFGVQNAETSGDVTYKTGAQDIVNIIQQSIKMYGGGGMVGAKGTMVCTGDAGSQKVNWGLF